MERKCFVGYSLDASIDVVILDEVLFNNNLRYFVGKSRDKNNPYFASVIAYYKHEKIIGARWIIDDSLDMFIEHIEVLKLNRKQIKTDDDIYRILEIPRPNN